MSRIPCIARAPLTSKQPEARPYCRSHNLTRRATRKKKLEIVQLWCCASCKRVLTPGPAAMRNKTYPLRIILAALTGYDLGYTLEETAARLKKKANRRMSPSTITSWFEQYLQYCSYRRLRAEGLRRFSAHQTIRSIKLYYRQVYGLAYHRPKLQFIRADTLDDKRVGDTHFAALANFPGERFLKLSAQPFSSRRRPKARASQARPEFAAVSRIIGNRNQNAATDAAALIISAVGNNKLRHETL